MAEQQQPQQMDTAQLDAATQMAREVYPVGSQMVLPAENNTAGRDSFLTVKKHDGDFIIAQEDDEPEHGADYITTVDALALYRPVQTVEQAARAALALIDELVGSGILDVPEDIDIEVGVERTRYALRAALAKGTPAAAVVSPRSVNDLIALDGLTLTYDERRTLAAAINAAPGEQRPVADPSTAVFFVATFAVAALEQFHKANQMNAGARELAHRIDAALKGGTK
jgi:hypothetical protein